MTNSGISDAAVPGTSFRREGAMLLASIEGRATGDRVNALRAAVERALDGGRPFTVLFDRRTLTAVTSDGREALECWGEEITPRLAGHCLAWADLFDERRAASLARAEAARAEDGGPVDDVGYPQRTFSDLGEARRWLTTFQAR